MIAVYLKQQVAQSILASLVANEPLEAATTSSLRTALETALEQHNRPETILEPVTITPLPSAGDRAFHVHSEQPEGTFDLVLTTADDLVLGRLRELIAVQNLGYTIQIGIAARGSIITRAWEIPS